MNEKSSELWDVLVIGGGAGGLSAALILARAQRRVLVLDGEEPRNRFAGHMHGVLSRDGYSPLALLSDGRREVRASGGVVRSESVATLVRADAPGDAFEAVTVSGERVRASRVIVATGIRDELPDVPGLAAQWGRGAVACPYCDGYEARGGRIGVLLGNTAGVFKAHLIRAYSPDVTVLTGVAGDLSDADSRALAARGIRVDDRPIRSVSSEGDVLTGVEFADGARLALDTLFVDPLMVPRDDLLQQAGADRAETPLGRWTTTDAMFQTSVPGLFAVGNVTNPAALVPVAAAAGVVAATTINAGLVWAEVADAVSEFEEAGARR